MMIITFCESPLDGLVSKSSAEAVVLPSVMSRLTLYRDSFTVLSKYSFASAANLSSISFSFFALISSSLSDFGFDLSLSGSASLVGSESGCC